ncbi:MAG TPA: hypothetical protein VMA97_06275, partial [Streptosporangiaceae bacterium]|nr:hypothetical protein [Streptosporangiaceae bacterium]
EQAYRMGVQPDRLAQEITEHGQIGSVVADVLRGKALNLITERVTVTDDAGKPVDVSAALRPDTAEGEAAAAEEATAEGGTAAAGAAAEVAAEAATEADAAAEADAAPAAEAAAVEADADGADQDETPKKKATRRAAKK